MLNDSLTSTWHHSVDYPACELTFNKVVNSSTRGKKKFTKRIDFEGFILVIREVAFIKYPALTEEGRWIKLLREYLWPLRDRLKFKKNAPKVNGRGVDCHLFID